MRALNIIGIIASIGIFWYGSDIIEEIEALIDSSRGYNRISHMDAGIANLFMNSAFFMMLVGLFFLGLYIANLKQIKRRTAQVMSVLGIIVSAMFILFNILFIASRSLEAFVIAYILWIIFGLICLAFTIVLLVQAVRDFGGDRRPSIPNHGDDVIDDFDLI